MKKVVDKNGDAQRGLLSPSKGIYVYDNKSEYKQYQERKEYILKDKKEIDSLKEQIKRLEELINKSEK